MMRNLKPTAFMRMNLLSFGLGLALTGAAVSPGYAANPALKTLPGHVPAIVAHLAAKGLVSVDTNLDLAIGLPLRNTEELTNLLEQVYDPSSPNYHHFLTPDEFAARFGPTEQDYQKVVDFANANGLTVTATHPNRMLLDVRGKAGNIENAFHVTLRTYRHPTENRDFFAPDTEPSVSAALPILDVSGLSNLRQPHPLFEKPFQPVAPTTAKPSASSSPNATTGSGPFGTYMGDDFRNAYVPGAPLNGSGQAIALVQFDGYFSNDIVAYENMAGRTNIPLQNVLIDGFSGVPTGNGGEVEVSLDIEMVISMAPALAKVIVYEGDPFNFHPNDVLNRIATDNLARQISCSWGWTGGPNATTDQIFQQMALQGQTFFTASGDGDAYPPGAVDNPFGFGTPADSPYLTSVGGTTLTMNGAGASYASETVWNWGIRYGADGIGSSGGFSSFYSIPSWQTNINMVARGGSATTRNFPDVALTADDVFVIADGGLQYIGVGGTSVAAPLWAGFTALVNQQAALKGRAPVGFLNPAIYAIANSAAYTNCFHDIVTGNNEWSGSPDLFVATNNYDLCTGLGTPNGTNLINALTSSANTFTNAITHISAPLPPYGTTLGTLKGGNPNGTWELFFQNVSPVNSGALSNGWILALTTANPVGYAADLGLTMTCTNNFVTVGSNFVCTLTLTNYGPSVSSNALVSDNLPFGSAYVSASATFGSVTRNGATVVWRVGTTNADGQFMLNTNAGGQMTLVLQANNGPTLINSAVASADTADFNSADASASVAVTVGVPSAPQVAGNLFGASGQFQLTISGSPLPTIIEASTNLINWVPVYTNTPPFTFTDLLNAAYPIRFYRASQ
jgi:uncharacterized repeat protein (TIGR01451 family)